MSAGEAALTKRIAVLGPPWGGGTLSGGLVGEWEGREAQN